MWPSVCLCRLYIIKLCTVDVYNTLPIKQPEMLPVLRDSTICPLTLTVPNQYMCETNTDEETPHISSKHTTFQENFSVPYILRRHVFTTNNMHISNAV